MRLGLGGAMAAAGLADRETNQVGDFSCWVRGHLVREAELR